MVTSLRCVLPECMEVMSLSPVGQLKVWPKWHLWKAAPRSSAVVSELLRRALLLQCLRCVRDALGPRGWRLDLMWSGRGYSLTLASVRNELVEDQLRLYLLPQVKDQPHLSKRTSRAFFEIVGATFLTKPALSTILVLNGPKSTIPCERNPCGSEHW